MNLGHQVQGLPGRKWISACEFHELDAGEVLSEVARRVSSCDHPLVLLDLDSTLYEVAPRTFQIFKEWASSYDSRRFPKAQSAILQMNLSQLGYSVKDTFANLGLVSEMTPEEGDAYAQMQEFWN